MRNAVLLLLISLSFGLANANTSQTATAITKDIYPVDDTYVFGRGGQEVHNIRGLEDPDFLKSYYHPTDRSWAYETYLKFDLSAIINNPDLITNVKLRLYGSFRQQWK